MARGLRKANRILLREQHQKFWGIQVPFTKGTCKGAFNIEFMLSVIMFSLFSAYVAFYIFDLLPVFSATSQQESLRAKSYELSELLINNPGEPANWSLSGANAVKRHGLSMWNDSLTVNYTKLELFNQSTIEDIQKGFFVEYSFSVIVRNASNNEMLVNKTLGRPLTQATNIVRIVPALRDNGDYERLEIFIRVWKV